MQLKTEEGLLAEFSRNAAFFAKKTAEPVFGGLKVLGAELDKDKSSTHTSCRPGDIALSTQERFRRRSRC